MAWHEILATGIILAGTAFYCWAAYSRKSGPTSCIGCGKCVADGVCILTGKKVPGISAEQPLWSGLRRAGRLIPVSG